MPSPPTSSPATPCTSTTPRCRSWRRAPARPKPADCGPTSATSGRLPVRARRRPCSSTRPTAKANTRRAHLKDFRGVIHADGYAGFNELFAGGTDCRGRLLGACAAQILRCSRRHRLADRQGSARPHRPALRGREDNQRITARPATTAAPAPVKANCRGIGRLGRAAPCASSLANPSSPRPSATCGRAGLRWCAASTTAASPSTTTPPSAPCAASRCGVHCAPLLQVSGNIGSWFAGTMRHGRPVRPIAAATRSCCRSSARIW